MCRKGLYIIIIMSLYAFPVFAQSWESVKASRDYLWGEGFGSSILEADQQALRDLISKISVHVSGDFKIEEEETTTNGKLEAQTRVSNVVNTYSQATLTNTERLIIQNEPDAHVGRWVKRSEVNRIFESRKAKVKDLVGSALRSEKAGKVDFALKDYYWALTLLKSLQHPNEVSYASEDDGKIHLLMTWIPEKMNLLFCDVSIKVNHRDGDDVELDIYYKGKPVNSLDYTYFDGRDWSNIYSAKDGHGVLELAPGNVSSTYQIKLEYEFRGEAHIDKELESVLNVVKSTPMRGAYLNVKAEEEKSPELASSESGKTSFSELEEEDFEKPKPLTDAVAYQLKTSMIVNAIRNRSYDLSEEIFTPNGLDVYQKLIKYGSAKVVGIPSYTFYRHGDYVICRGLQLSFSFKSGMRKSFVEDVVFTFNKQGLVDNIAFGLGQTAEDDILGKKIWNEKTRMAIMQFLENYQTAYALKRLDFIETIFDDDAVIITGTVAQRNTNKDDNGNVYMDHKIVKYNRYDKRSYLKHLAQSFASKEYINLRFADNEVKKLGEGGETYGIQISQEYYSSNYGDKGYLFLMIDINDPDHPIIKVRTWQPEKDPNFGVYSAGVFF